MDVTKKQSLADLAGKRIGNKNVVFIPVQVSMFAVDVEGRSTSDQSKVRCVKFVSPERFEDNEAKIRSLLADRGFVVESVDRRYEAVSGLHVLKVYVKLDPKLKPIF